MWKDRRKTQPSSVCTSKSHILRIFSASLVWFLPSKIKQLRDLQRECMSSMVAFKVKILPPEWLNIMIASVLLRKST